MKKMSNRKFKNITHKLSLTKYLKQHPEIKYFIYDAVDSLVLYLRMKTLKGKNNKIFKYDKIDEKNCNEIAAGLRKLMNFMLENYVFETRLEQLEKEGF